VLAEQRRRKWHAHSRRRRERAARPAARQLQWELVFRALPRRIGRRGEGQSKPRDDHRASNHAQREQSPAPAGSSAARDQAGDRGRPGSPIAAWARAVATSFSTGRASRQDARRTPMRPPSSFARSAGHSRQRPSDPHRADPASLAAAASFPAQRQEQKRLSDLDRFFKRPAPTTTGSPRRHKPPPSRFCSAAGESKSGSPRHAAGPALGGPSRTASCVGLFGHGRGQSGGGGGLRGGTVRPGPWG
jgi:hypothetical protein